MADELTVEQETAIVRAIDHASYYKAYRHSAVEAFLGALREGGLALAATPAPDTGAEERLRAALRKWVGLNAMRWDKYPSGTTVVDAEALDSFLSGGSVDEEAKERA